MTALHPLANARFLALEILLECRKKEAFVQELLDQHLEKTPLAAADRRLTTQLVYGVLRRRGTLDFLLRPRIQRQPHQVEPWIWECLRLGAFQLLLLSNIPAHAAVNETVELANFMGVPRARGFINGVLRALVPLLGQEQTIVAAANALPLNQGNYRLLGQAVLPDPIAYPVEYLSSAFSLPEWLADRWLKRYGWEKCLRLGFWFAGPAPLLLRVNRLRMSRADFLATGGEQFQAADHPQAVLWRGHGPVTEIPGFADGFFVVQDEAAMQVATALAPEPGQRVLDLCAAPGGKTTHLAELMNNQGQIVACDVDEAKLEPLAATCRRLGLTIVETAVLEAGRRPNTSPKNFDAVLVDVPCSNTGVLGRRPEARWRLQPGDIKRLVPLQQRLLREGCASVRPGGKVVYSTCSIEPEENQQIVQAILGTSPDFVLEAEQTAVPGRPADGGYWARLRRSGTV